MALPHGQLCFVLITDSLFICFGFKNVLVYSSPCELGIILIWKLTISMLYS